MKRKGTYVERKVKQLFERDDWIVIRSTGSFGKADLTCLKSGKVIFIEVKSTRSKILYYRGWNKKTLEKFPFFVVADFGYGALRILKPKSKIKPSDGIFLKKFLEFFKKNRKLYKL